MIHAGKTATRTESMALNIRNKETEQLAAALASLTGETKTEAVRKALAERLERTRRTRGKRRLVEEIDEIADHCASLPCWTTAAQTRSLATTRMDCRADGA